MNLKFFKQPDNSFNDNVITTDLPTDYVAEINVVDAAARRLTPMKATFHINKDVSMYSLVVVNDSERAYKIDDIVQVTDEMYSVTASFWPNYMPKRKISGYFTKLSSNCLTESERRTFAQMPEAHRYAYKSVDIGFNPRLAVRVANDWSGTSPKNAIKPVIVEMLRGIADGNTSATLDASKKFFTAQYQIPQNVNTRTSYGISRASASSAGTNQQLSYGKVTYYDYSAVSPDYLTQAFNALSDGSSEDTEAWIELFPRMPDNASNVSVLNASVYNSKDFLLVDLDTLPTEAVTSKTIKLSFGRINQEINLNGHIHGKIYARLFYARQKNQKTHIQIIVKGDNNNGEDTLSSFDISNIDFNYVYSYLSDTLDEFTTNMPGTMSMLVSMLLNIFAEMSQAATGDMAGILKANIASEVIAGLAIAASGVGLIMLILMVVAQLMMGSKNFYVALLATINGDMYKRFGSPYARGVRLGSIGDDESGLVGRAFGTDTNLEVQTREYTDEDKASLQSIDTTTGVELSQPVRKIIDLADKSQNVCGTLLQYDRSDVYLGGFYYWNGSPLQFNSQIDFLKNGFMNIVGK